MQALTLQDLFGVNAVQTADKLIIQKSNLSAVGLTATANNRAEQLVVAIFLQALSTFQLYLADETGDILADEMGNRIGFDNKDAYELLEMVGWDKYIKEKNSQFYLTDTIVINYYAETN